MNKKFMRSFAFLMLFTMLITSSFSCSDTSNTGGNNNSADDSSSTSEVPAETTSKYLDSLPENLDFEGRTIRIITNDADSFETVEDAADVVDTAVYNRNLMVEERLNVSLQVDVNPDWGGISSTLTNSVLANSDDFDVYAGYSYWSIDLATSGYLVNLANQQYLDFEQPYWGKKFIDAMSYKDYIYWATGDIVLNYTNGVYATYVNLDKWNSYFPEENIYQIVRDGKWTLENFLTHSEASYNDLNGNSKSDEEDMLGYVYTAEDNLDGLAMAAGVKFTEFDQNGVPYVSINQNDIAVRFSEMLEKLCSSSGSYQSVADGGNSPFDLFVKGNVMFTVGRLWFAEEKLRDMPEDFAIVPAPKLDESQETYLTTLHDGTTIIGLPKTISDDALPAVCASLEALAAESYKSVTPAYLDVALKNKYSRDPESAEMIDLIRENIISDFGFQYTSTGFNNFFRGQTTAGGGIASTIAKKEKAWTKLLEKIIKSLEENSN